MRLNVLVRMLGAFLCVGAVGEIAIALHPALLPREATAVPFMAAHQTSWLLRGWILGSNIVTFVCATTLVRFRRDRPQRWRQLRTATGTLALIAATGVLVSLVYLLPLRDGPARTASQLMLVSVVSAGLGLASVCALLFRHARRHL